MISAKSSQAAGAIASGRPGWPLLASCIASIESVRMVSMQSWASARVLVAIASEYEHRSASRVRPTSGSRACPDFDFEPRYREEDGLRLAYLDEGEGPPVVFWHGEPTWSFLWRKVIPPVRDAGFRCIVPDQPGFGRSDKPTDLGWYSYDRFTHAHGLIEHLDLRGATFVVHDWGGPVGLRTAVELADRVDRLVIMDTGVFTGQQKMSDAWGAFRDFVERTEDLPVGFLVQGACGDRAARRGRRRLRRAVPRPGVQGGRAGVPAAHPAGARRAGRRGRAAHARRRCASCSGRRSCCGPTATRSCRRRPARRSPRRSAPTAPELIPGASHFLQEDQGELIGRRIADWLTSA